jgi:hypothetical protein
MDPFGGQLQMLRPDEAVGQVNRRSALAIFWTGETCDLESIV